MNDIEKVIEEIEELFCNVYSEFCKKCDGQCESDCDDMGEWRIKANEIINLIMLYKNKINKLEKEIIRKDKINAERWDIIQEHITVKELLRKQIRELRKTTPEN